MDSSPGQQGHTQTGKHAWGRLGVAWATGPGVVGVTMPGVAGVTGPRVAWATDNSWKLDLEERE